VNAGARKQNVVFITLAKPQFVAFTQGGYAGTARIKRFGGAWDPTLQREILFFGVTDLAQSTKPYDKRSQPHRPKRFALLGVGDDALGLASGECPNGMVGDDGLEPPTSSV
jgi:hypothetical protein